MKMKIFKEGFGVGGVFIEDIKRYKDGCYL